MTAGSNQDRPRRVTMVDVAKRAGVSQPTVSVVLSGRADAQVAEETRERVLHAARELGFRPNRLAQSLRLNRSDTVGVITNGIVSQPYAGLIIQGLQQAVQPAGMICMVVETSDDPTSGDEAVADLLDRGVAGIVYASPSPKPVHASSLLEDTTTLFVNCWADRVRDGATVVLADEYGGGLAAARSVFAAGHRDVAYVGGQRSEYACVERERGFADAAREAGVDPDDLERRHGNYAISSGYDLVHAIFAAHSPTALVCGNDRMAIGAILALHELDLEVPGDVSVVGFDDQPDVASQVRPALTTVALPHLLMGQRAGTLLVEGAPSAARVIVPCSFVPRDSLAPPPRV